MSKQFREHFWHAKSTRAHSRSLACSVQRFRVAKSRIQRKNCLFICKRASTHSVSHTNTRTQDTPAPSAANGSSHSASRAGGRAGAGLEPSGCWVRKEVVGASGLPWYGVHLMATLLCFRMFYSLSFASLSLLFHLFGWLAHNLSRRRRRRWRRSPSITHAK